MMVNLKGLASHLDATEKEILDLVAEGALPKPTSQGTWALGKIEKTITGDCHIYFIKAGDFIKIGKAASVASRMLQLQAACPLELTLLHSFVAPSEMEARLHRKFKEHRTRGEWFAAAPEILDYIASLKTVNKQ